MTSQELRKKYLSFFKRKNHTIIPSASLVPAETDSSVLFTTAGMHPLVPYLLGEKHPGGKRVVNVQKCVRTIDIDEVGDNRHLTFFEMMGNWSFGDYFKKEAIEWSFEFLTGKDWLNLDKNRIYVTVFKGEGNIPRDDDSIKIWKDVFEKNGMKADVAADDEAIAGNVRIIPLGVEDNFWIAGTTGPCGGDTEMFYDTRPEQGKLEGRFSDLVKTGRLIEIWNDVFMEFNKKEDGSIEKLKQQNVDTGMGVERTLAVLNGKENVFDTELFIPIFDKISEISSRKYQDNEKAFRIIADHIKAAVFMIFDGVEPSNTMRGYVLRRLIRRAIRQGRKIGIKDNFIVKIGKVIIGMYKNYYPDLEKNEDVVVKIFKDEEIKFQKPLDWVNQYKIDLEEAIKFGAIKKIKSFPIISEDSIPSMEYVYENYQSYGVPYDLSMEVIEEMELKLEKEKFDELLKKHQELSRASSTGAFKGGLADTSEITIKYHTATHLLLAALREILGPETYQKGSNITSERLRFDFNYQSKLSAEQIKEVENLVNQKIKEAIPVEMMEMPKEEALKSVKVSFDPAKYGNIVKVYKIGDFSSELCGGPHVTNTSEIGQFKIQKEEASSSGVRRIKAIIAP